MMLQVAALPEVMRPLTVSLYPFMFQVIAPVANPIITTLPLPKPLGITSLLPPRNVLFPVLLLALRVVVPLQSLPELVRQTVAWTATGEHKLKLYGPDNFAPMAPLRPPLPHRVVSPMSVQG